jgi:predicted AlkP superfamily pyrophosphatase or phosphodiesterase
MIRTLLMLSVWILICTSRVFAEVKTDAVVIISIDSLHPTALSKKTAPNLYNIMQQGVFTLNGNSTNPPKTLISHTAMHTGLSPDKNGKTDNIWKPGQPQISISTIFHDAKDNGFETIYVYAKSKLGYLENNAQDKSVLSTEEPIETALEMLKITPKAFLFLHISGLDILGPKYGWMSKEYLQELTWIDEDLLPLISLLKDKKNYLLIITSDHSGHDKIHGSQHPEDFKLPFIIQAPKLKVTFQQDAIYQVTDLRGILKGILSQ